jgi:hypothetical protein
MALFPPVVAGFSSIKHDPQSPLILVSFLEQGDKDFFKVGVKDLSPFIN